MLPFCCLLWQKKELSLIMCNNCFQEIILGTGVDEGPGWTQGVSDTYLSRHKND